MHQPKYVLAPGVSVHTHQKLDTEQGMAVMPSLLANRRGDADGAIYGIVPGHGGDVYWVKHADTKVAPYCFTEFELAQNDTKNKSA